MTISPTALTVRLLREEGWPVVEVVEHYNSHVRRRFDLFGFIDVLAIGARSHKDIDYEGETLAVQATSVSNVSARIRKIAEHPNVGAVRDAGWGIEVHGWAKRGGRWVLARRVDVS